MGIMLDPPYSAEAGRDNQIYAEESLTVAHDVRRFAIEKGKNPKMRIALCGYDSEHSEHMPKDWSVFAWKTSGGYGVQSDGRGRANRVRERIWFSPGCINGAFESFL